MALAVGSVIAVGAAPAMAQESLTVTVPPLAPEQIAPGVKIAGVDVGGLGRADARAQVLRTHVAPRLKPVVVVHRGKRIAIRPASVGYAADIDYALTGALLFGRSREVPAEGVNVPLRQSVDASRLKRVLVARVARFDVAPRDAAFSLRGATPVVREARPGIELNVPRSVRILRTGLVKRTRSTFKLPVRRTRADITTLAPAIIIDRGNFRLTLWKHRGKSQVYPIAVGTSSHPTPAGNFEVIQKQVNPTWFPPSSPWAAGLGPVPPGPGNPLGTRWIGTSAPAIGIHGTPVPSSIGTRASHGCIRMYIRDVERLYPQVDYGTRVYIR
jgi:lipoprotein-anchoring transpeptidase ErfK/SrfK